LGSQALHHQAQEASQVLERARAQVEKAAASVYARPAEASRALLGDSRALERLSAGEAGAYGELRGRTRVLLGDDATRSAAHQHVSPLWSALRYHGQHRENAARALEVAGKAGLGLAEIQRRLSQLGAAVRQLERAAEAPEEALKVALRELGRDATRVAVALLPAAARVPVNLVLRAVERALSHGYDLGR
jgi:hypothetical protein